LCSSRRPEQESTRPFGTPHLQIFLGTNNGRLARFYIMDIFSFLYGILYKKPDYSGFMAGE